MNELYKQDYENLPPDEKAAWNYDHYLRTRIAIDKYFVSYGLDVAMVTGMMERAKELDVRYQTMIDLIDKKLLPPLSQELNGLESLFADLFREVLRPLPNEIKY
ncbi:hypothetical protein HW560_11730 [Paenibacillus sp. E222]|uniref:hypothetical protein n=1 Tax=Paenibacillus sp. E222 TaxID=2748863 RepID=UPI0015C6508F|nr:hypothetical protein [Paenibacillus sp. E222]QLG38709.1 hypothetical protein HW560_11730 [Paenibacillus sp. E222]